MKNKSSVLILLLFVLLTITNINAQNEWTYVYNTNQNLEYPLHMTGVFEDHTGQIWFTTSDAGVFRILDSKRYYINPVNSQIPSDYVYCMAEEADGTLWFGTNNGLAKFNGTNWKIFNTNNSSIPDNSIVELHVDKAGTVWAGTDLHGLAKYENDDWVVYDTDNSQLPNNRVYGLANDSENNLWIATLGNAAKFDGENWEVIKTLNSGLPHHWVWDVEVDSNDTKWFATEKGLASLNGDSWKQHITGKIVDLSVSWDNKVYAIDYYYAKVAEYSEGNGWKFLTQFVAKNQPTGILAGSEGKIWTTFLRAGTRFYDETDWKGIKYYLGMLEDDCMVIESDQDGRFWLVYDDLGIGTYKDGLWNHWPYYFFDLARRFYSIAIDSENIPHVATNDGIFKYENGWQEVLANIIVNEIKIDTTDKVIGINENNLIIETEDGFNVIPAPDNAKFYTLHIDDDNKIWIGSDAGLGEFVEGEFIFHYLEEWSASYPFHISNVITFNNELWFSTTGSGIWVFDGENFTRPTNIGYSVYNLPIVSMKADNNGSLFLQTNYNDLIKITPGKEITTIPLPSQTKTFNAFDKLWIAGKKVGYGYYINPFMAYYEGEGTVVGTDDEIVEQPTEYSLLQNYPNPFNPTTRISYDLPEGGKVKVDVYNLLGERISTLVNSEQEPGRHTVHFDAGNLASGIYIYTIITNEFTESKKMILIK